MHGSIEQAVALTGYAWKTLFSHGGDAQPFKRTLEHHRAALFLSFPQTPLPRGHGSISHILQITISQTCQACTIQKHARKTLYRNRPRTNTHLVLVGGGARDLASARHFPLIDTSIRPDVAQAAWVHLRVGSE